MTRIGQAYSSGLRALLLEQSKLRNSPKSKDLYLNDKLSQNEVVNKIEKHISDVKSGNGDASRDTASLISEQNSNAFKLLSQSNIRALEMYSGYLSGLRYDRAARFVNGVEYSLSKQPTSPSSGD